MFTPPSLGKKNSKEGRGVAYSSNLAPKDGSEIDSRSGHHNIETNHYTDNNHLPSGRRKVVTFFCLSGLNQSSTHSPANKRRLDA